MTAEAGFRVRLGRDGAARVQYPSLVALYDQLNAHFWAGALPPATTKSGIIYGGGPPPLVVLRRVSCGVVPPLAPWRPVRQGMRGRAGYARGLFRPPGAYFPAAIRIMAPLAPEDEREVLLHEMIHCGLWFAGFPTEGHGPRFLAELERLAAAGEAWAAIQAARLAPEPGAR